MPSLTKTTQFLSISRIGGAILAGMVMVKMGLDLKTIGQFELLFFLGKAATTFWSDALAKAILPLYPKLDKEQQKGFFATSVLIYLGFSLATWVILMLFKTPITTYFLKVSALPYYNIYVLFLALNIPGLFLEQYYTLRNDSLNLLIYSILSYALYPIYFLIPIYLGLDLGTIFKILIGISGIRLLWIGFIFTKETWLFNSGILRKLLSLATHFMAYILVAMMAEIVDGYIINHHYSDPGIFAIFRYGARELPLTIALLNGLSIASVAKLSSNLKAHLPTYKKSLTRILQITFPIAIVLMITSQWLFVHFFSGDFRESALVFNTYLLILGSRVLMPGPLVISKLESRYMFRVSIIELLINVVLSLIFIQYWGLIGVAFGTVLAHYFEKMAYFYLLQTKYQVAWTETIDKRWFLAFWVVLHVCYAFVVFG